MSLYYCCEYTQKVFEVLISDAKPREGCLYIYDVGMSEDHYYGVDKDRVKETRKEAIQAAKEALISHACQLQNEIRDNKRKYEDVITLLREAQ